jgi:hypothetical protein
MRARTRYSIAGMILGVVTVTVLGVAAGIGVFPSLAISLVGLAFGGWLAERRYEKSSDSGSIREDARAT